MSRSHTIRSLFCLRDEGRRGAVAIQVALMLIAIIGFASLGTEIVLLLSTSRHMQSAADAGVLAAVSARTRGFPSPSSPPGWSTVVSPALPVRAEVRPGSTPRSAPS
jgi:hypothetical protein